MGYGLGLTLMRLIGDLNTRQGRTQDKAEHKTRQNTRQGRTQDKAEHNTRHTCNRERAVESR
jgi:hypothetical protein